MTTEAEARVTGLQAREPGNEGTRIWGRQDSFCPESGFADTEILEFLSLYATQLVVMWPNSPEKPLQGPWVPPQ